MTVVVNQTHSVDEVGVRQILADHYAAMGLRIHPSNVSFQVLEGHSSGFSSSDTRLGETTIRIPESVRSVGAPSSMTLRPEDLSAIVAQRLTTILGFDVSPGAVTLSVRGAGGSGFSSSSAEFTGASIRSTRRSDG